jgi:hypothetical protein
MTELAVAIALYLIIPIAIASALFWVGSLSLSFMSDLFKGDK